MNDFLDVIAWCFAVVGIIYLARSMWCICSTYDAEETLGWLLAACAALTVFMCIVVPRAKPTAKENTTALLAEMAKLQAKIDTTTAKLTTIERHMHTCGVKDWLVYDGRGK